MLAYVLYNVFIGVARRFYLWRERRKKRAEDERPFEAKAIDEVFGTFHIEDQTMYVKSPIGTVFIDQSVTDLMRKMRKYERALSFCEALNTPPEIVTQPTPGLRNEALIPGSTPRPINNEPGLCVLHNAERGAIYLDGVVGGASRIAVDEHTGHTQLVTAVHLMLKFHKAGKPVYARNNGYDTLIPPQSYIGLMGTLNRADTVGIKLPDSFFSGLQMKTLKPTYKAYQNDQVYAYSVDRYGSITRARGTLRQVIGSGRIAHSASTRDGSSGFPVVMAGTGRVALVHTRAENNLSNSGAFIGPFLPPPRRDEAYASTEEYKRAEMLKRIDESRFSSYEDFREHYRVKAGLDSEDKYHIVNAIIYRDSSFFDYLQNDAGEYAERHYTRAEEEAELWDRRDDPTLAEIEEFNRTLEDRQREREIEDQRAWEDTREYDQNAVQHACTMEEIYGDVINSGDHPDDFFEAKKPIADRIKNRKLEQDLLMQRQELKRMNKKAAEAARLQRQRTQKLAQQMEEKAKAIQALKQERMDDLVALHKAKEESRLHRRNAEIEINKLRTRVREMALKRAQEAAEAADLLKSMEDAALKMSMAKLEPTPVPEVEMTPNPPADDLISDEESALNTLESPYTDELSCSDKNESLDPRNFRTAVSATRTARMTGVVANVQVASRRKGKNRRRKTSSPGKKTMKAGTQTSATTASSTRVSPKKVSFTLESAGKPISSPSRRKAPKGPSLKRRA